MTALQELVIRDAEIKAAQAERRAAEKLHIDPIRAKERKAGEMCRGQRFPHLVQLELAQAYPTMVRSPVWRCAATFI